MKKLLGVLVLLGFLSSCNVTETIVFTEDGSGDFLVTYDMTQMMSQMKELGMNTDSSEKKEGKEVMDTTMVFAEIMENHKDSIAALPEEQRLAIEYVKDMYMTMHVDEEKAKMNMGIGMKFNSINDLKDIQKKIKKAQSLGDENKQIDAMRDGSPMGKFMGDNDGNVAYNYTTSGFTRSTAMPDLSEEEYNEMNALFNNTSESDKEFMDYFKASYYTVKLVFPKRIKSTTIEDAQISDDGKTLTYKTSWLDYIKNPKTLDVDVKFYE
ncbi:MAG: hypothetical protein ED556_00040 [Winogradskyella sp.]|uniref:hypothetical protein n=1 Tax=Winogradskyella sp. TaxID=1883156 RepID=UPI000F409B2B|nr:hypothetical protein [Winogradskyella sp.]RNC87620.1 MAG: hypothetical protein ED556_00040 [Winogradskyella sp.]